MQPPKTQIQNPKPKIKTPKPQNPKTPWGIVFEVVVISQNNNFLHQDISGFGSTRVFALFLNSLSICGLVIPD